VCVRQIMENAVVLVIAILLCAVIAWVALRQDSPASGQRWWSSETNVLENTERVKICRPGDPCLWNLGTNEFEPPTTGALLLHEGTHALDNVNVGYYQSILGLDPLAQGKSKIAGSVTVPVDQNPSPCALDNFWRSLENVSVDGDLNWYVSQASPLRVVTALGKSAVAKPMDGGCYASGGYAADCIFHSTLEQYGNQQWFLRNSDLQQNWSSRMWNTTALDSWGSIIFSDQGHSKGGHGCWHDSGQTGLSWAGTTASLRAGLKSRMKPFLCYSDGAYAIRVPDVCDAIVQGPRQLVESFLEKSRLLRIDSDAIVVTPEIWKFRAIEAQARLDNGAALVFLPGVYDIEQTLLLRHPRSLILGVGQPVLNSHVSPCISVQTSGPILASLLIQLCCDEPPKQATSLVEVVGSSSTERTCLFDIWVRYSGETVARARQLPLLQAMVRIEQANVMVDGMWVWRADHTSLEGETEGLGTDAAAVHYGLHVAATAENVFVTGLQSEHTLKECVLWEGNKGTLLFLQVELPYDLSDADTKAAGLRVTGKDFVGGALGVYAFTNPRFCTSNCDIKCGIDLSEAVNPKIQGAITVHLKSFEGTSATYAINHVFCPPSPSWNAGDPTPLRDAGLVCVDSQPS